MQRWVPIFISLSLTLMQTLGQANSDCFKASFVNDSNPEESIQKITSSLTDREIMIRLVFAETLASGCPSQEVAQGIAWILRNRWTADNEARCGTGRGIAFKDYQFRSTMGSCDVAKREAFLCPTGEKQFSTFYKLAEEAWLATLGSKENPLSGAHQYFLPQHFDLSKTCARWKGVLPNWAKPNLLIQPKSLKTSSKCITFYK